MSSAPRPLLTDRTFWGLLLTQFLGAFNDNVFKFLVMFLCTDRKRLNPLDDWQGIALVAFASPFVLFSGISGFTGDRFSKSKIIQLCKVLEIAIMGIGLLVFWLVEPSKLQLALLLGVLFLMGMHSTLFGPAKYGILPELYPRDRLPVINGWFLMTTFIAIIGGVAAAGMLKDALPNLISVQWICVAIAIVGTLTSLLVQRLPAADANLKFSPTALFIDPETRGALKLFPSLKTALIYSSVFWFVGGVFQPAVNAVGTTQFGLSDSATGRFAATTAIGIAIGSALAGKISRSRFRAGLVRGAAFGLMICLAVLGIPGGQTVNSSDVIVRMPLVNLTVAGALLTVAGLFAGLYAVPLQVYLQAMAPEHLKGRMIGAMNLINWIGIVISGVFYELGTILLVKLGLGTNVIFGGIAVVILVAAVTFPMQDQSLSSEAS
jgi:acyl-[acyl-carrier-protein]-phospholipid O-acyltransferase/long-chain-fatty-acid--[acyl-carrier-protein] ligase